MQAIVPIGRGVQSRARLATRRLAAGGADMAAHDRPQFVASLPACSLAGYLAAPAACRW